MSSPRTDSPVVPFKAEDETGTPLPGFATTETTLNTRLAFCHRAEGDLCIVGITDMSSPTSTGHHIYITTATMKDLIKQFSDLLEFN
jgi:hypothetical protein